MNSLSQHSKIKVVLSLLFFLGFIFLSLFIYLMTHNKIVFGYNQGYRPDQPVPFSHEQHVGQYKMDCRYCHTAVEEGRHAGIPSLDICMNCHLSVKVDSPWIEQLRDAYVNNRPVVWEKVHLLPDFVKFNHSLHVKALSGKTSQANGYKPGQNKQDSIGHLPTQPVHLPLSVEQVKNTCTHCHGLVETMETVYQKESLSMGWCVNCHREEKHNAPINCTTCHY